MNKRVFLLFLLALSIRLILIGTAEFIGTDGVWYVRLAQSIVEEQTYRGIDGQLHFFYPPGYPLAIALISLLFKNFELSAKIVSAVAGALLIFPIYYISRKISTERVAIMASFLVAIWSILITYSVYVATEALYITIFYTNMYVVFRLLEKGNIKTAWLCGAIFGILYLIKPEAVMFLAFTVIFLIGYLLLKHTTIKKIVFIALSIGIAFLLVSSPYLLFMYEMGGSNGIKNISGKTRILFGTGELTNDVESREKAYYTLNDKTMKLQVDFSSGYIDEEFYKEQVTPIKIIKRFFHNLGVFLFKAIPGTLHLLYIVFLFFGATLYFMKKKRETIDVKVLFLIGIVLFTLFLYSWIAVVNRFVIPLIPLAIIFIAKNIDLTREFGNKFKIGKYMVILLISLTIIYHAIVISHNIRDWKNGPIQYKEGGLWIKENYEKKLVIMEARPYLAYYSGNNMIYLPFHKDINKVLEFARYNNVSLIALDSGFIIRRGEPFNKIEEEIEKRDDIKLVYTKEYNERSLKIYEVS